MLNRAMLLALAGVAAAAEMPCGSETEMPSVTPRMRSLLEIAWKELDFPDGDDKHLAQASKMATVDGQDYATRYEVLLRSGDKSGDGTFGQLVDMHGEPIMRDGELFISDGNDFASLMPKGDKVYMVTHFEAPTPSASYLTKMRQDYTTGKLVVDSTKVMDWSAFGGLWVPCAGSVTPWQTHFGSEEYEPDARVMADWVKTNATGKNWDEIPRWADYIVDYFKMPEETTNEEAAKVFLPYNYGYPWEVKVDDDGEIVFQGKHYAMGRLAIELPYLMPGQKVVYITDDGSNTMLGAYKMTKAGDFSCGTLWGAKMTQKSDVGGGEFDVDWVQVGGEMCSDEVAEYISTTTFYDLFDAADPSEDAECPEGYTSINPGKNGLAAAGQECLRVKEGMEDLAARFEFRRYAEMMGATAEFSKWEGVTYDTKRHRLYTAMSEIREGMEDNMNRGEDDDYFDVGGNNDLRLEYNPCGCVYAMDVDHEDLAVNMYALVCGNQDTNVDEYNACDKESIAGPDNVAYIPGHDGLVIGEDTAEHQNDVLWYYNFDDGSLTRFLSTPYGAETTSPFWYPNINGWAYLMAVVQHPYGESDEDQLESPLSTGLSSYCGYVGPFKAHPGTSDMNDKMPGDYIWNGFPNLDPSGAAPKCPYEGMHMGVYGQEGKGMRMGAYGEWTVE